MEEFKKLEAAESEEPTAADVKVGLGRAFLAKNDLAEAGRLLDEAVEAEPENLRARLGRSELNLQRKDYQTAATDAEKVVERQPDNAYAHYYAGIAYSNLRRPDKMANHFQLFLKLAPDAPEAAKVQSLMRSLRR